MFLGKVIGNVVATQKDPKFQGMKLLLVQPTSTGRPASSCPAARSWRWTAWARVRASACSSPGQLGPPHPRHPGGARRRRDRRDRGHGRGRGPEAGEAMSALGSLPPASREQVVAEIAREVVARLQAQLAAVPEKAPAREAPRVAAPRPGHGVFATVDEAVAAASRAQVKVAAMSLERRGEDRRDHPAPVRGARPRPGRARARRDRDRAPRPQDPEARGRPAGARRRGHADRRALRRYRPLCHRARTVGRGSDGAAGHALGSHDGEQRHQRDRSGQHGRLQPTPRRLEGGRPRAPALQPGDRAGDGRRRRPHHGRRALDPVGRGRLPAPRGGAPLRHRGAGRGTRGHEGRQARDRRRPGTRRWSSTRPPAPTPRRRRPSKAPHSTTTSCASAEKEVFVVAPAMDAFMRPCGRRGRTSWTGGRSSASPEAAFTFEGQGQGLRAGPT